MLTRAALTPLFRTWWRFSRGMTLGVRGIACDAAGAVLLVRHTYRVGWWLPGGGVEHGQTVLDALAAEMAQEAGVAVEGTPRILGLYSNHRIFRNDHVAVYLIDHWRPCPSDAEGEIAEIGYFGLDALPEGVTAGTRRRLEEAFAGAAVDAFW